MSRNSFPAITAELARELLVYDPNTGSLHWRIARPGAPKGALVGTRTSEGYTQIEINYRLYRAHRVIWLMMTGMWPKHHVDHINGVRADNRWKNLREATPLQNSRNRVTSKKTGSGRVGVSFIKSDAKWHAYIGIDNRTINLGRFTEIEDAVAARVEAERVHFGEFAPGQEV